MEKINVVLVVLKKEFLEQAIRNLNFDRANLATIIMDGGEKTFSVGDKKIPITSFATALKVVKSYKNFVWLIVGYEKGVGDVDKMKKFLQVHGIAEGNIVNFELSEQINSTWIANVRHIEERGADFFVTGNEFTRDGVDFNLIPPVVADNAKGGVNLADAYQDLQQSYLTAKHVFEHVAPDSIKFVLIGLEPDSFCYDNAKDFPHCAKNFQYVTALNFATENTHDKLLKDLVSDDFNEIFATTSAQADLNFGAIKDSINRDFLIKAIVDWEDDAPIDLGKRDTHILKEYIERCIDGLNRDFPTKAVIAWEDEMISLPKNFEQKNIQILKDYIELCLDNGARPVGIILPFSPAVRKNYPAEVLKAFREIIQQFEESYNFLCVDWFDHLDYNCFYDMTHLNSHGALFVNSVISMNLNANDIIPAENFRDMNYLYFKTLAWTAAKDDYNALMERIFKASAQIISRKKKIKIGFTMVEAAHWCGKDLYDFFANDERFETTVFLCLDFHKPVNDVIKADFMRGVDQLKSHGINVVPVTDRNAKLPVQDVLIYLSPYLGRFPVCFNLNNVTAKTLAVHIPYAFDTSFHIKRFYSGELFIILWKVFFSSAITFDIYKEKCIIGMPRGLYSGYPRMDIVFKPDTKFHFDWKMARPDAKKIIWAPHHSIKGDTSITYATFQWNWKFMYEFAKANPAISWIFKPHPWLLYKAVREKVFPSAAAFQKYLQMWDELPNAMVYTGGYYQDIFATSDGLIHDCGSFSAEYQYVNKPMIYLTRPEQNHNKLGEEILKASYLVDGRDFKGIAMLLQRLFIEGKDDKAAKRKQVFDKYLNYPKTNGMLASEFIYKSIADEFK